MNLLIYLPAFNEEKRIQDVLFNLPDHITGFEHIQYLVVDDGSVDKTREHALSAGAIVFSHERNRGVGAAFHTAVSFAIENDVDVLVSIDADGQFDSSEIPFLVQPVLQNKADMVMGNRFHMGVPKNMPRLKYWGNKQMSRILYYISKQSYQDVSCGFRAYSREALLRLNIFGDFTYTHETILSLLYQGLRVLEKPISVRYDDNRVSRVAHSVSFYASEASKIIFRILLDYKPMRVLGTFGGVLLIVGFFFIFYLLVHYVVAGSFTPYKSFGFIGLGFFIFGLLVFVLALIADMLKRMRLNQDRQLYTLKKTLYDK